MVVRVSVGLETVNVIADLEQALWLLICEFKINIF
jgi:O-acetylhomoserine/O-acetylserine sulfhydrylase-like pyridoxal-dependent enzyme